MRMWVATDDLTIIRGKDTMFQRTQLRAALISSLLVAAFVSGPAKAQQGFAIDRDSWADCIGDTSPARSISSIRRAARL